MNTYEIYTDGACSGNPGAGGCSYILLDHKNNTEYKESFYSSSATNNRMEMSGAIFALERLKTITSEKSKVKIFSDSQYLINAFNKGWITKWRQNNWKLNQGDDVKNKDLWKALVNLSQLFDIEWIWIRGHSDNHYNELCDELAKEAIKRFRR